MKRSIAAALLLVAASAGAAPLRAAPVDPRADARTRAEYAWLLQVWGGQTIAGQQDLTWNDGVDMAQRVFDDTGKYPALMGFDFMNTWTKGDGAHQVD